MRERLKSLASGNWSSLTLCSLQLKAPHQNLEISEEDAEKRMTNLLKVGQISKAYKVLTGDRTRLPQDSWAYELLKSKFPEQGESCLTHEQRTALRSFESPFQKLEKKLFSGKVIRLLMVSIISEKST